MASLNEQHAQRAKNIKASGSLQELAAYAKALAPTAARGKVEEDHKVKLAQIFAEVAQHLGMLPQAPTPVPGGVPRSDVKVETNAKPAPAFINR